MAVDCELHTSKPGLCIVCYKLFNNEIPERDMISVSKVYSNFFKIFCHYSKLETMSSSCNSFDFQNEPFPFCESCKSTLVNVFKWHNQVVLLHKRIDATMVQVTSKLLESQSKTKKKRGPLTETVHDESTNELLVDSQVEKKVDGVRKFIMSRYEARVSIPKLNSLKKSQHVNIIKKGPVHNQLLESVQNEDDDHVSVISLTHDEDNGPSDNENDPEQQDELNGMEIMKIENEEQDIIQQEEGPLKLTMNMDKKEYYYGGKLSFTLVSDISNYKRLACTFCSFSTAWKNQKLMIKHLGRRHYDIFKLPKPPKETRKKIESDKRRHFLQVVEGNPNEFMVENYRFKLAEDGLYYCSTCTYTNKTRRTMMDHVTDKHISDFTCETCGLTFGFASRLEKHQLIHTGERPYACKVCNKRYRLSKQLKLHEIRHRGVMEKNYVCGYDECGKKFSSKCKLNKHNVVHTGEVKYSCSVCDKKFKFYGSMARHKKSTHEGDKPYTCPHSECGMKFTQTQSVKRHLEVVHGREGAQKSKKSKPQSQLPTSSQEQDPDISFSCFDE